MTKKIKVLKGLFILFSFLIKNNDQKLFIMFYYVFACFLSVQLLHRYINSKTYVINIYCSYIGLCVASLIGII